MINFAADHSPHMAENPGWGKLIGLVVAALLFWLFVSAHTRMKKLNEGHSPAPEGDSLDGAKPQVAGTAGTNLAPRGRVPAVADDDLGAFVEKHAERLPTKDLVRLATAQFRASKRTVLRRLADAKRRKEYGS